MINLKTNYEKAKKFVKEHPTLTACVVTAVVTRKVTHNTTIRGALRETTDLAYDWGRKNGVLSIQNAIMIEFIDEKNLGNEFLEFIFSIKNAKLLEEEMLG